MNDATAARWPPWFGPLALVLGLVFGVIVGGIFIAATGGHGDITDLSPVQTDVATLIQDAGFVLGALVLAANVGPLRTASFGLVPPPSLRRTAGVAAAAVATFAVLSTIWFSLLHQSGNEKDLAKAIGANSGTLGVLAACALVTVVAPLSEELLFRGFLFRSLVNWRGIWPAALIAGVLFGAVHIVGGAPAVDVPPLMLLGVLMCLIYARAGSLYPCIVLHEINNAIALGGDEGWRWRTVELAVGGLVAVGLVLWAVRLASARWTPATD